MRPATERAVSRLSSLVLRALFREVTVVGRHRLADRGPAIVVANHGNGLVDPMVVVYALEAVPRFVVKATLWRRPLLRRVLRGLGVIPVARRQDGAAPGDNAASFAAAHRALADGAWLAVFPEGTAHDEAHLLPVRTGTARMALGGRAEGARGLQIVPVGIIFEDKLALRSRALAVVGEPLDLDAWAKARGEPTVDDSDRDAVADLTATIAARLQLLAPDFDSVAEARVLTRSAEVFLRASVAGAVARPDLATALSGPDADVPDTDGAAATAAQTAAAAHVSSWVGAVRAPGSVTVDVPLAASSVLAAKLGRCSAEDRLRIADAYLRYQRSLNAIGLRDDELMSTATPRRLAIEAFRAAGRTVGLAPWAVLGAGVHAVPYAAVRFARRWPVKPAQRGTVVVLTAVASVPAAWLVTGWLVARRKGSLAGLAAVGAAIVGGVATVQEAERFAVARRAWRGTEARGRLGARIAEVTDARDTLVRAVAAAETSVPARASSVSLRYSDNPSNRGA